MSLPQIDGPYIINFLYERAHTDGLVATSNWILAYLLDS